MFGDRLDTDIKFGINSGLTTVLTLTGNWSVDVLIKGSVNHW